MIPFEGHARWSGSYKYISSQLSITKGMRALDGLAYLIRPSLKPSLCPESVQFFVGHSLEVGLDYGEST